MCILVAISKEALCTLSILFPVWCCCCHGNRSWSRFVIQRKGLPDMEINHRLLSSTHSCVWCILYKTWDTVFLQSHHFWNLCMKHRHMRMFTMGFLKWAYSTSFISKWIFVPVQGRSSHSMSSEGQHIEKGRLRCLCLFVLSAIGKEQGLQWRAFLCKISRLCRCNWLLGWKLAMYNVEFGCAPSSEVRKAYHQVCML